MLIITICSLIALLLTYLESSGKLKDGMKFGFIIVTIIECIHYDYGNDYMSYYNLYNSITNQPFDLDAILSYSVWKEPGWAILNYLFVPLGGFFGLIFFISIIQNVIYYRFIKRYTPSKWLVMSVFIYLFSTNYYLLNMSMLRQGLAIALFVASFDFILKKKILPTVIIIIIAASLHNSARILILFIPFGFIPFAKISGKLIALISATFLMILFFSNEFLTTIFDNIKEVEEFSAYVSVYEGDQQNVTFGLGFVMNMIPFLVMLLYLMNNRVNLPQKELICLAMIGTMIIPFAKILPLITRVGMYFGVFTICTIPISYRWIHDKIIRTVITAIYVFMTLYNYYIFFTNSVFSESYSTFKTIFSV